MKGDYRNCSKCLWDRVHERGARFCKEHDRFSSYNRWNPRCQLVAITIFVSSVFLAIRP